MLQNRNDMPVFTYYNENPHGKYPDKMKYKLLVLLLKRFIVQLFPKDKVARLPDRVQQLFHSCR